MKNFIFITFSAIVVAYISYYFLTDKPDIVYSLSNDFYTSLENDSSREIFQQLSVKNVGSKVGEKLIISIDKPISNYEIKKYSKADSIRVISTKSNFELIYPSLPPQGKIDILLKNNNEGVGIANLQVKHNSGLGREVFETNNTVVIWNFFGILFYLCINIFSIYGIWRDSFNTEIKYDPIEGILKRSKPFLIALPKWEQFRKEALENYFKKDYLSSNIETTLSYQYLNSEKPKYLNEEEWKKVSIEAVTRFKEVFSKKLLAVYYFTENEEIFTLQKPKYLPIKDWNEILKLTNTYYLYLVISKSHSWGVDKLEKELRKNCPEKIDKETEEKCIEIIRANYFIKILDDVIWYSEKLEKIDKYDLNLLSESQNNKLKKILEFINKVLSDDKKLTLKLERNDKQNDERNQILVKLSEILKGEMKDSNKDLISTGDWEELTALNEKISAILKNEKNAAQNEKKFNELKTRVESQLEVIDKVLLDPKFVTKIEDYNDIFNSGNFKNLVKIARSLNKLEG